MRILALLPGLLLAVALAAAAPASAPLVEELGRDWFTASLEAGYGGYVFPMSEPALARASLANSGFAWQAAFDQSTIPVRLTITHRRGAAFRGHVEVETSYAYSRQEDPAGRNSIASAEFIAPPSVPTDICLAPRVCAPCAPGQPLELTVRLYQQGVHRPLFTQVAEVIQLEPAHLYSLQLDAPSSQITHQAINAGNHLGLTAPLVGQRQIPLFAPELLESTHYLLPQDHRQVTCLPLAATQFAFVVADTQAVRSWSVEDQAALAQFLLGGGYLCLYHAAGDWQGLNLGRGAQTAGRGVLLPVAGGPEAATAAMGNWLEGELVELLLWLGGAVHDETLGLPGPWPRLGRLENLQEAYGPAQHEGEVLARRPGYLHPVLLYRETSRLGALEPWDFPEFLSPSTETLLNNVNLRQLPHLRPGRTLPPLAEIAAASRPGPLQLWLIVGLALTPALGASLARRAKWWWLLGGAAGISVAIWAWHAQPPIQAQPIQLSVYDSAQQLPGIAIARQLHALQTGPAGAATFALLPGSVLRHVAWQPPGDWSWAATSDGVLWQGRQGGAYAALATAAPSSPPELPVRIHASRSIGGMLTLEFDTSALERGTKSYLVTPLGIQVIPGGTARVMCELPWPRIPTAPGLPRLRAIAAFFNKFPSDSRTSLLEVQSRSYTSMLAEAALPGGPLLPTPAPALSSLAVAGLLQQPGGIRSADWNQLVLITPLPGGDGRRTAAFARYCLPVGEL